MNAYRCGVGVVSTMPTELNGSLRPSLHVDARPGMPARGTPDPDDYSSGFAVWSGSSFSAPAYAGQVATELAATQPEVTCEDRIPLVSKVVGTLPSGPRGVTS